MKPGPTGPQTPVRELRTLSSRHEPAAADRPPFPCIYPFLQFCEMICCFLPIIPIALLNRLLFLKRDSDIVRQNRLLRDIKPAAFAPDLADLVDDFSMSEDGYYDIDVTLSNDFSNLAYVYVIKNPDNQERTELEKEIIQEDE